MAVVSPPISSDMDPEPDSGLDLEQEEPGASKCPFDPAKIKMRTVNVVVDEIVSRIDHDEIDLAPEFQRVAGIWNDQRKSRLIESLLLRIPIPAFYVAADDSGRWSVVDGVQRTSAIYGYVKGSFKLSRIEYLTKFERLSYEELPRSMQRRIDETPLVVNVIEPGTPQEVMFNIFKRIITGGMTLSGQEIRHVLHPGPARDFLIRLVGMVEFLKATDGSIRADRMADRECVLRFLAFHIDPWEKYSANDLDGYLGLAMKKINSMSSSEQNALASDFKKSMNAAYNVFRRDAFRKPHRPDASRSPISKALFETWGVGLARRSEEQLERLVNSREKIVEEFITLMRTDGEFERAITYSTGTRSRVRKRFQSIDRLIERCL